MGRREFREKYAAALDGEEEEYEHLMEQARQELPAYFEQVLAADKEEFYSQAAFDLEMSQLIAEQFPSENFDLLMQVIQDPRFLRSSNGWVLFSTFHDEREKLNEAQKIRLLDTLGNVYERLEDWMACFSISELVGEDFASESAFGFFSRFIDSQNETARTFVPHGFEHALRTSKNPELTTKIWGALSRMEQDESQQVRNEVKISLGRLQSRGISRP